ncbi:MAG: NUDIX domain-containing protein [Candidatus Cryptobacteroides sp.]|nr:NUDIX domain-containing protein [Bacteroidales bacterium]
MLPIIRENGIVYAQASRAYCHVGSFLLHPVVHLHILNRNDELYLQKRSMKKDLLPGMWDTAVGGHVDYGEYIGEALHREAAEELKFYDFNPIYLGSYVFQSSTEREMVNVFAVVGNFNPHPDLEEVEEGRYWAMEEIEANIGKSVFTPNFEGEFHRIRRSLEALL